MSRQLSLYKNDEYNPFIVTDLNKTIDNKGSDFLMCDECDNVFKRLKRKHKQNIRRGVKHKFCSLSCRSKFYAKNNKYFYNGGLI